MFKKVIEVSTKRTSSGIEPDITIVKGMDVSVLSYSADFSTAKCLVVRSDVNDFTELQGKNMVDRTATTPINEVKNIIRKKDKDGKVTDSLDVAEIGTAV
jgi:hypothetical protein